MHATFFFHYNKPICYIFAPPALEAGNYFNFFSEGLELVVGHVIHSNMFALLTDYSVSKELTFPLWPYCRILAAFVNYRIRSLFGSKASQTSTGIEWGTQRKILDSMILSKQNAVEKLILYINWLLCKWYGCFLFFKTSMLVYAVVSDLLFPSPPRMFKTTV